MLFAVIYLNDAAKVPLTVVPSMLARLVIFKCPPIQRSILSETLRSYSHVHQVLDEMPQMGIAAVNDSMHTCVRQNRQLEALRIFSAQVKWGYINTIDEASVAIALKACRGDPRLGRQIHGFALSSGLLSHLSVSNSLMNMYCKCGEFDHALYIFGNLKHPDTVSWNTILTGFQNSEDALGFSLRMHKSGVLFDAVTHTTVLALCSNHEEFVYGAQLHSLILKYGLDGEVFIGNALITMYSRWGNLVESTKVFEVMPYRDLVSWNALISAYMQEGHFAVEAISAFIEMVRNGMKLDHVSFTKAVSACGHERNLNLGKQVHGLTIKAAHGTHVSVCNVLMSMYSKCEAVEDAELVFESMTDRNVISWTTILSIKPEEAVSIFNVMRQDRVDPNDVTFIGVLHGISIRNVAEEGRMIHGFCLKSGFLSELNVSNSLITMYAKVELMDDSAMIFNEINHRDVISWNALISGYAQNEQYQEALQAFFSATVESQPNQYTFGSALSAIGAAEATPMRHGQRCHSLIIKLGFNTDPIVSGALLDMYAKRGSISESHRVFSEMPERGQVAWTAIISAYSRHGDYESVMSLFEEMESEHVKPDAITFLAILTACARKGMVDMGRHVFKSMVEDYHDQPLPEHYSCIVDMLGRAGRLKEAIRFVDQIPGGPGLSVLQSLLGACTTYKNVEIAERVADALKEQDPMASGSYVQLSNIYAARGDWEKVAKIRKQMRKRGVKKEVGFSRVDVGDTDNPLYMHGFSSGDKSHPRFEDIYWMADCVGLEMRILEMECQKEEKQLT